MFARLVEISVVIDYLNKMIVSHQRKWFCLLDTTLILVNKNTVFGEFSRLGMKRSRCNGSEGPNSHDGDETPQNTLRTAQIGFKESLQLDYGISCSTVNLSL